MAPQPNLNQEGYDIADVFSLLLLGTIQEKHIFLTKEDSALEMKKKKKCLQLKNSYYSLLLPILNQVLMQTVTACLHDIRNKCFLF